MNKENWESRTTKGEAIEKMEKLAIEKGYTIEETRTPAYDFTHAVKGNVKIHIASLSNNGCKLNTYSDFEKEICAEKNYEDLEYEKLQKEMGWKE